MAFQKQGSTVTFTATFTCTTVGTAATAFTFTLPYAPFAAREFAIVGRRINNGSVFAGRIIASSGTLVTCTLYDGSFGLGSGDVVVFTGTYEAA